MEDDLIILEKKIRKLYLEPQPEDDFKQGWCYAIDWVFQYIKEIKESK